MQFFAEYLAALLRGFAPTLWLLPLGLAMELLLPVVPGAAAQRLKGLALGAVFLVITSVIVVGEGHAFRLMGLKPLISVGSDSPWWLIVVSALIAAVIADFFYYWCHRLQHTPLLWRFHAVHHSIRDMSTVNSWHHWTEELIHFFLIGTPIVLIMQVSGWPKFTISALIVTQTMYIHVPTKLHFGPFRWLLVDNRFHRHHHIRDESRSGQNFGVFTPLWDVVFGTAYFPRHDEWCEVGLENQPEIDGLMNYLWPPRPAVITEARARPYTN